MIYKDQTFCNDWCDNKECFRNFQHIVNAYEKQEIDQNEVIHIIAWQEVLEHVY